MKTRAGRVLFLSESQGWSGGAKQLLRLAEGLRSAGWDVRIASPGDGEAHRRAKARGFEVLDLHPRQDYDLTSALRLAAVLEAQEIDVLHAHHPRAHAVGLMAAYLSRRRAAFVVTRRVSFPMKDNVFSRLKYRNGRIDGYIAVAESIRQGLIRGGVEPARIVTIPSGVDLEAFSPRPKDAELSRELALPPGVPVVGVLANFGAWKGQSIALEAAERLRRGGRRAVFLFAGRDTDGPELRALAARLPAEEVRLLGFRDDVPRLLSLLDVSVNASTDGEGLSGAIRESLAMGIPVAASDVGGNGELVKDGETGRLFPKGSAEVLAAALEGLLADPAGAKRLAEAGRAVVRERFSDERMWRATAAFYERLLQSAPGLRQSLERVG